MKHANNIALELTAVPPKVLHEEAQTVMGRQLVNVTWTEGAHVLTPNV